MKTLLCPKCGCDIEHHYQWCYTCDHCRLSYVESRIAAQQAAACAHLKALGREAASLKKNSKWRGPYLRRRQGIMDAIAAYRAIGVLNSPKEKPHD